MIIKLRADALKSNDENCTLLLGRGEEWVGVAGSYISQCLVVVEETDRKLVHLMMFPNRHEFELWEKRNSHKMDQYNVTLYEEGNKLSPTPSGD